MGLVNHGDTGGRARGPRKRLPAPGVIRFHETH
jgi:hypothetical protein